MTKVERDAELTYAKIGIDRKIRQKSQIGIQAALAQGARQYKFGKPLELPFGYLFPYSGSSRDFFDLQIEGVGTKILLAELVGKYDTVGVDGVAMAVNDIVRSGADPVLISDGIHINKTDPKILSSILSGIKAGAESAGCTLASGETGDVSEILHHTISQGSPAFDLFVSCLGLVHREDVISGKISPGDHVIGLESSGIHSNGMTLARRVLLRKWGGIFNPEDVAEALGRPVVCELLEPTRIYAKALTRLKEDNIQIKAALHVTGDGLAKFWRLLKWQKSGGDLGMKLRLSKKPAIFELIRDSAKRLGKPISVVEMFRTFNMGIGFAMIFSPRDSARAIDSLSIEFHAEKIGFVYSGERISVESPFTEKPILL